MKTTPLYILAIAGASLILPPTLPAQQTPETGSPAASGSETSPIDDIRNQEIITLDPFEITEMKGAGRYGRILSISGSRQAIPLADLPRAISVVTSELIEDTVSLNILEAAKYSSGITVLSDSSTPNSDTSSGNANDLSSRLRIRGFKISTVYRDFNPTQYSPWGPLIDRIEVVKGPASALYGRAAPGGTVNYILKRPNMHKRTSISFAAGLERNQGMFRGIVDHENLTWENKLGYRVVAAIQESDGIKDFAPNDHATILANLKWEPTRNDTLLLELEYANDEGHGASSMSWKDKNLGTQPGQIPRSFPQDRLFNARLRTDFSKTESVKYLAEYRRKLSDNWHSKVNYEHSERNFDSQFTLFASVRTGSENVFPGTVYNPEGAVPNRENLNLGYMIRDDLRESDSVNASLVGNFRLFGTKNSLLLGGTHFTASSEILNLTAAKQETIDIRIGCPPNCPAGTVPIVVTTPLRIPMMLEDIHTFSYPDFIADATDEGGRKNRRQVELGPDGLPDYLWRLGQESTTNFKNEAFFAMNTTTFWYNTKRDYERVRLMYGGRYDEISQDNRFTRITRNTTTFEEELVDRLTEGIADQWTYQFSTMFKVWKHVGFYYSRSTSFVQQFSSVRERNQDPSRSTPAGPLLGEGDEVGVKFSLFDGFISGTVAAYDAQETNRVTNVGEDRFGEFQQTVKVQYSKGLDIDLTLSPNPQWQTLVAVSYIDSIKAALDLNDPNGFRFVPQPNIPWWQAAFFSSYRVADGPLKGLMLGFGGNWVDNGRTRQPPGQFGHPGGKERVHLTKFFVADLALGYDWTWRNVDWSVQLNVKNLFDVEYFTGGASWGDPRNSQVSLKMSF